MKNWIYQFLRKTQKYTSTDNVYLASGGFWLGLTQIVSMATSFLLALVFANLVEPDTYGKYKYVLSLMAIFSISSLSGIETAITQATARNLDGSFYTGFKAKFKWGLIGSVSAIGLAAYYIYRGNYVLPIPLLIGAALMPLIQASSVYGSFLTGKKLFRAGAKYGIISHIIFAGAMAATMLFTKNIFWLIAAYFISNALLGYLFYLLTKFKFRPNKEEDVKTISFGKHLSLMGALDTVGKNLDKILLFNFIGSVEVAIYSFAIIIPDQIRSLLSNISALAMPKLAAKSQKEIKASIMKKVWKLFILVGLIIVSYALLSQFIYKTFFPQYLSSVGYSQMLILSLISFPTSLLSAVFHAKMMKRELYLLRFIGILRLILLVVLVPIYGIIGAVSALVGAQIFGTLLVLFLFYLSFRRI